MSEYKTLTRAEVTVGDKLDPVDIDITTGLVVGGAIATRDLDTFSRRGVSDAHQTKFFWSNVPTGPNCSFSDPGEFHGKLDRDGVSSSKEPSITISGSTQPLGGQSLTSVQNVLYKMKTGHTLSSISPSPESVCLSCQQMLAVQATKMKISSR